MQSNAQFISDFVEDTFSLDSVNQRFSVFEEYVQKLGFDGVSYTVVPDFILNNRFNQGPVFLFSELFPESFIEQYTTERFDQNDFSIKRIKAGHRSSMDWKLNRHSNLLSQDEKKVLHIAEKEHDVINAITIPTMAGIKGISGVSVVSSANDSDFRMLKSERLSNLEKITDLFHRSNAGCDGSFIQPFLDGFSEKDIRILRHLRSGGLMKNVKHDIGISVSYASNLLSKLTTNIGDNVTINQIMYELGEIRFFDDDKDKDKD